MELLERYQGCLLGLVIGDAAGTAVEFKPRGTFEPLEDMIGGGYFNLVPGQWTDDTSMALCLTTSLIKCKGFDANDQMKRYCLWQDEGYLSSTGKCFDIGNTVSDALDKYRISEDPYSGSPDSYSAGNGSTMRLAPITLFYYPNIDDVERYAAESSKTTHGAKECIDACRLLSRMIFRGLNGLSKEEILFSDADSFSGSKKLVEITCGNYIHKSQDDIKGSGYVVDSLEAALWCFYNTPNLKEAILRAANLGDAADTTSAVCGQIAGAYYGISRIPNHWLNNLTMKDKIIELANLLYKHGKKVAK